MSYYIARKVGMAFDEAVERVTASLAEQGFGILTEIDVRETLKKKLDVEFRPYRILGACNPPFAYQALQAEDKIGVLMPCNVIVQELEDGVEVAAMEPVSSMRVVDNPALGEVAEEVRARLERALDALVG